MFKGNEKEIERTNYNLIHSFMFPNTPATSLLGRRHSRLVWPNVWDNWKLYILFSRWLLIKKDDKCMQNVAIWSSNPSIGLDDKIGSLSRLIELLYYWIALVYRAQSIFNRGRWIDMYVLAAIVICIRPSRNVTGMCARCERWALASWRTLRRWIGRLLGSHRALHSR